MRTKQTDPCDSNEVDDLLKPIARELISEADVLLDLRGLLLEKGHPGSCVRCFFQLFQGVDPSKAILLAPLRRWLEQQLEIVVLDRGRILEVLPFVTQHDDSLESFCRRSINQVRLDRTYQIEHIDLKFRYREMAA